MNELLLTVKQVAKLKGCGERNIQLLIEQKKLDVVETDGQATGRGGLQYRSPLSPLDNKLQLKHKRIQRKREKMAQASLTGTAPAEIITGFDAETLTAIRESARLWQ